MHPTEGFSREAGPFVKLWAAICSITGWKSRCPRCRGKIVREYATDESYRRPRKGGLFTPTPRMSGTFGVIKGSPHALPQLQITPVYDVCTECGHRIRRRNVKAPLG